MRVRLVVMLLVTCVAVVVHARDAREEDGLPPFSVALEPEVVPQGGILRVVVRPLGRATVREVKASFAGRNAGGVEWARGEHHALLPISINEKPGDKQVRLKVRDGSGAFHDVMVPVTVREGTFDTDELGVSKSFTSPTKKQQAQARADSREFQRLWSAPDGERRWRGSFIPPVPTRVTAPYGTFRTINGKAKSRHLGLDLQGRRGDPIFATNDAKVVMARSCFYSGNTVVLDHGQGLFTLYFHMTEMKVKPGQTVRRGALLGTVGATGRVTGPHLHFAVKMDRTYVNPQTLLALDLLDDPRRPSPAAKTSTSKHNNNVPARHIPERAGEPGRSRAGE